MSAKTYRFPEILGCGEHEAAADTRGYPKVAFDLDGLTERLWLWRSDLTLVVPPLPEEPPMYTAVFVEWPEFAPEKAIFRRYHLGWCEPGSDPDHPLHKYRTWAELNEHGTPVILTPAPVVERVTLPWEGHSIYGTPTRVRLGEDPGEVLVEYNRSSDVILAPDTADAMAAALTTAAAKARQS